MPKNPLVRLKTRVFSIGAAAGTFLLQAGTLARAPQNPDGAEMVAVVEQGRGVLHPPGFPLQSWLNDVVGWFPVGSIAVRLSVFSLLCQSLTVFFLAEILRSLGTHPAAAVIGLTFYALFPAVWEVGVQPEKYALTGLLMAVLAWGSLRIATSRQGIAAPKNQFFLGLTVGLGFAQHLIFTLALPFAALPFIAKKGRVREALRHAILPAILAAAVAVAFYLSLLIRARGAVWPDWGKLTGLPDLLRHVLRRDFGGGLSPYTSAILPYGALPIFIHDYWRSFLLLGALPVLTIYRVFRAKDKPERLARQFLRLTALVLGLSLLFLAVSRLHPPELVAYSYLTRYSLPACLAIALLSAWAMNWIVERCGPRLLPAFLLLTAGFPALVIFDGWPRVNLSRDRTLDIYRETLGVGLDDGAIFVQSRDLDVFYGAKVGDRIRYPLLGDYPWALRRANYAIEPRLPKFMREPKGTHEIALAAYRAGYTVISANQQLAMALTRVPESRGVLWVADPRLKRATSARTAEAAFQICRIIRHMDYAPPPDGHFYSRSLMEVFRYPFYAAARYFEETGRRAEHEMALQIAFALYRATEPRSWMEGCEELLKFSK